MAAKPEKSEVDDYMDDMMEATRHMTITSMLDSMAQQNDIIKRLVWEVNELKKSQHNSSPVPSPDPTTNPSANPQLMPDNPFIHAPLLPDNQPTQPISHYPTSTGFATMQPQVPTLPQRVSPILKPRDIPMLHLDDLHGVETESTLTKFYGQIESCVLTDEDRLQVAQSRMDNPLSTLIQTFIKQKNIVLWEDFKKVMDNQFQSTTNITEAWQQIEEENYDIEVNPRAFVNKLACKMAAISSKFPRESLPDQEKLMKRKLFRGLPRTSQNRLVDFVDSIAIGEFLKRVEDERRFTLQSSREMVNRLKETEAICSVPTKQAETVPRSDGNHSEIQQKLDEMSTQLKNLTQAMKSPYCGYCRTTDHTRATCPLNPPRGACFDCMQLGCRRGSATCPGRQSRQPRHAQ